jgi:hypothetical protein
VTLGRGLLNFPPIDKHQVRWHEGVTGMSSPRHREADVVLRDGSILHVRPVRAEDAAAVEAFFKGLSPESIALRFFCGFPDLPCASTVRWAYWPRPGGP